MSTAKKTLITLFVALLLFPAVSAGQIAFADSKDNWEKNLPDWEIRAYDDIGLVVDTQPFDDSILALDPDSGVPRKGYFDIKNMSPGDIKTSIIKITSNCTFDFHLKVEVNCLDDSSTNGGSKILDVGQDGNGNDIILARQVIIRTYLIDKATLDKIADKQVEIEAFMLANNIHLPSNTGERAIDDVLRTYYRGFYLPVESAALKAMMNELETYYESALMPNFPDNSVLRIGDVLKKNVGRSSLPNPPAVRPGSVHYMLIEVELPGASTGNEYQNKRARFEWVFTAEPIEPGPGDDDDDDDERDADADSDGDADTDTDTEIRDREPPGGGYIPEPPEVIDLPDPDVPGGAYMPKTGEAPLWYSLLPGLALILAGMILLIRKKEEDPEAE